MIAKIEYQTSNLFTLGELRAIIAQQKELPDECVVHLHGQLSEDGDDAIVIEWDEA